MRTATEKAAHDLLDYIGEREDAGELRETDAIRAAVANGYATLALVEAVDRLTGHVERLRGAVERA